MSKKLGKDIVGFTCLIFLFICFFYFIKQSQHREEQLLDALMDKTCELDPKTYYAVLNTAESKKIHFSCYDLASTGTITLF